jgi:hypothetical protein
MTLRFFRKHKKLGIILLISAVFAMVTFSVLFKLPDAWQGWFGDPYHLKMPVMAVYGKQVPRLAALRVRENLSAGGPFNWVVFRSLTEAMYSPQSDQRKDRLHALSIFATYMSPMPVIYHETTDAEEKDKVVEATLVLLAKAERIGLQADEATGEAVLKHWKDAGIPEQEIAEIQAQFFPGPKGREVMVQSLAQDLVLSSYITLGSDCSRVFRADVAEEFRSENDKAAIKEVTLPYGDFKKDVAEPTQEQMAAQFAKYQDVVAGPDQPFGYKVPDRVKVAYVTGAESDFEPTVTVSDSEIQAYYDEHKEKYILSGSETVLGPSAKNVASGAAANVPSGLPAKVLNAPDLPAVTVTGGGANVASGAAAGKMVIRSAVAPQAAAKSANVSSGAGAGEVSSGLAAAAGVRYKPLAAVREDIERKLRHQKATAACFKKIREAYVKLSQQPMLSLENVADGKLLKVHDVAALVTAEQAGELPGIGAAKGQPEERMARRYAEGVPFNVLAFAIKPFTDDPLIHKDRVAGPLMDEFDNSYLFKVTAVEAGHKPAALAEVKDQVIRDLKKKAAYELALKAGEALVAAAEKEGLAAAAKPRKLTVEMPEPVGRDEARAGKQGNPRGRAVFEAADGGKADKKVGLVGSETYDEVHVFEVEKVEHGTAAEYEQSRAMLAESALQRARSKMMPTTPQAIADLIRESGAKMLDTIDYREAKKGAASSSATGVAMPPGT